MIRYAVASFLVSWLVAAGAHAGDVLARAPDNPKLTARYLFYLHGHYVEKNGSDSTYRYREILHALARRGFTVIGEERAPGRIGDYARDLAAQMRHLLDAGVPPSHVGAAGHSRGGMIALAAATRLGRPDVRFAILAGCARPDTRRYGAYTRFIHRRAAALAGRFLVMWDSGDDGFADCDEALKKSGASYTNRMLETGDGHQLFYKPQDVWIDPLVAFFRAP